ncbi:hypothetical protein [Roseicitreum antarcticum]|uniref:Uncharacterized protein n=1 Tax=Roseicitreum antarcticum TaxID=564137 RepID=A0A1H3FP76_9RHOB|nr:hypothetical protein [Roseicitreum antarcticum]SDX91934.1 hypothetical protein SAMN04488238_1439 [Roseicitreum antarcticum]
MILTIVLLIAGADGPMAVAWFAGVEPCEMIRVMLSGHGISGECVLIGERV